MCETENIFYTVAGTLWCMAFFFSPHIISESKRIAGGILYKNENYCVHPVCAGSSLIDWGGDWFIVWMGLQAIGYPEDMWLYGEPDRHADAEARLSFLLS